MNIYEIRGAQEQGPSAFSLSIDPGVATSGYALLTRQGVVHSWKAEREDTGVMSKSVPELLVLMRKLVGEDLLRAFEVEEPFSWHSAEVVMEYPHISGQFSLGLSLYMSELVSRLLGLGVMKISFLPNRIPEWFLKQRGVSGRETVALTRSLFPWVGAKRISVHECDALLFSLYKHYRFYNQKFGIVAREPLFTTVVLDGK